VEIQVIVFWETVGYLYRIVVRVSGMEFQVILCGRGLWRFRVLCVVRQVWICMLLCGRRQVWICRIM